MTVEEIVPLLIEDFTVEEVTSESNLEKDLQLDSLDRVDLMMELEYEFKVEISDEDAQDLKTVQEVIDYIKKIT